MIFMLRNSRVSLWNNANSGGNSMWGLKGQFIKRKPLFFILIFIFNFYFLFFFGEMKGPLLCFSFLSVFCYAACFQGLLRPMSLHYRYLIGSCFKDLHSDSTTNSPEGVPPCTWFDCLKSSFGKGILISSWSSWLWDKIRKLRAP